MQPLYTELDPAWAADLAAKRRYVREVARIHCGQVLNGTRADLNALQKILDEGLIAPDETAELQALGVVFGDVLAPDLDAEWKQVQDEYGDNPVLKVRGKRIAIGALTVISKRVEEGQDVDIEDLRISLIEAVREMDADHDDQ